MNMSGGGGRIGRGSENGGGGSASGWRGRCGCGRSHYRRLEAMDRDGVSARAKTESEKIKNEESKKALDRGQSKLESVEGLLHLCE